MAQKNITGIILAGGNSSRMGTDKGVMDLNGEKVIQYVIEALKPNVDNIIIIANNSNYLDFGFPVYRDEIKDCGPLGGIYSGLLKSTTDKNIVLSCDIPFITSKLISQIIAESSEYDVTVPVHDGKTEPLCAVYTKNCMPKFKELLENKILKLTDAMAQVSTKQVLLKSTKETENNFINLNSKEDFNKYVK